MKPIPVIDKNSKVKKIRVLTAGLFALSMMVSSFVFVDNVNAAAFDRVMVRFDRMTTSTATTGTVCADPGTTSTDVKTYEVTFPTGYTVNTTGSNWQTANISTTNLAWPTGGTAWPNATSATASVSGQTVTWTNASAQTMNNGTLYCFNWTNTAALTTDSSTGTDLVGSVLTEDSGTATIDTSSYSTSLIADDQIDVTATVPQTFSFTLSGNSEALGSLSTSAVADGSTNYARFDTNAANGWQAWARDYYQGLCSPTVGTCTPGTATTQINTTSTGSNRTLSAGTSDYALGLTSSQTSGTGTIDLASYQFDGTSSDTGGGLSATALQTIASSDGTANNARLTLHILAAIDGIEAAASDYADTITVTGAGIF